MALRLALWLLLLSGCAGCSSNRYAALESKVLQPVQLRAASRLSQQPLLWDFQPQDNWEGLTNWNHHVSQSTQAFRRALAGGFERNIRGRSLANGDESSEGALTMSVRIYDIVRDWNPFTECCDYLYAEITVRDAVGTELAQARLRTNSRRGGRQPWPFGSRMRSLTVNLAEGIVSWLNDDVWEGD